MTMTEEKELLHFIHRDNAIDIIDYIDSRLEENKDARWISPDNSSFISIESIDSVRKWWDECMRKELMSKYGIEYSELTYREK